MKGIFITFEGIDGSGKSTQARLMVDYLLSIGKPVRLHREPGDTAIGERIRSILLDNGAAEMSAETELFLYLAARAQITSEIIRPALDRGEIVILDRFYDSTTAYQGYARGLDLKVIETMNTFATSGLVPDLTVYIDCFPDIALGRLSCERDRLESEGMEFMSLVRDGFLRIAEGEPDRFVVINGIGSVDDIFEEICGIVRRRFTMLS